MVDLKNFQFGLYPPEYNKSLHGPYDPARFYGKPDTPFGEVKLGELGSWFARRQKGVRPFLALVSRAWWRWQHAYVLPKRTGVAPFLQLTVASMAWFYWLNYGRIKHHKTKKYH